METEINQGSEAPDGANAGAGDEVMTRAEARKLIEQRQTLKTGNVELTARIAAQEQELETLRAAAKPPPTPVPAADMPEWAAALVDQNKALAEQVTATQKMFGDHKATAARDAVVAKVLADVPDGNHATAKALIGTSGIDFTQPGAAADALTFLREQHGPVMVDNTRGAQPRAPAQKPDGSPDFSSYRTFDEVPDAFKSAAMQDPETFQRLRGGGGASHGLNI